MVAAGTNEVLPQRDPTAHAEIVAIRRTAAALNAWAVGCQADACRAEALEIFDRYRSPIFNG